MTSTRNPARSSANLAQRQATDAQERIVFLQAELATALADRKAAVQQLRLDGRSLQYIADLLGLTKTAVANICG